MKVICSNCHTLLPEEQAVKMTQHDYEGMEQIKKNIPFMSYSLGDTARFMNYVTICTPCLEKDKW